MQPVSLCTITVCETMLVFTLSAAIQFLSPIIPWVEGNIYILSRGNLSFGLHWPLRFRRARAILSVCTRCPQHSLFCCSSNVLQDACATYSLTGPLLRLSGEAEGNVVLWLKIRSGSKHCKGGSINHHRCALEQDT